MSFKDRVEARRASEVRRSQLVPAGLALFLLGFLVPRPLAAVAAGLDGPLRSLAFIGTDLFRLAGLVGLGCLVVGFLRNRRWRREAQSAAAAAQPGTSDRR